jgi:AcrR family transcriptional regulator
MAYEVTKQIKGHEYRYVVESYIDEKSKRKKTRWHYLGPVDDGQIRQTPKRRHARVTRADVLTATARLLEFRDPDHITAAVIANAAGISHTTFYRFFRNPQEALNGAIAHACDKSVLELPSLEAEVEGAQEARVLLSTWCESLYNMVGRQRAVQRMLSQRTEKRQAPLYYSSLLKNHPHKILTVFLEKLRRKGYCHFDDAEALARCVVGIYAAVRLTPALASPGARLPMPTFSDLHQIVERAVFGS